MQELIQQGAKHTMSSQEIAHLTGKHHYHVMRDIERMLKRLEITATKFGGSYEDSTGRTLPCFHLDRFHSEVLITGYDVRRRAAVIERWYELETTNQQQMLDQTPTFSAKEIHGKLKAGKIPKPFHRKLTFWSHWFPNAVQRDRIRDDFILAPFLALEFAESLITAREDLLEKPDANGEDKPRGDFIERRDALRAWLGGNTQVQSLSAPLALTSARSTA